MKACWCESCFLQSVVGVKECLCKSCEDEDDEDDTLDDKDVKRLYEMTLY